MDSPVESGVLSNLMSNIAINTHEVACAIDRLPIRSRAGPDRNQHNYSELLKPFLAYSWAEYSSSLPLVDVYLTAGN